MSQDILSIIANVANNLAQTFFCDIIALYFVVEQ